MSQAQRWLVDCDLCGRSAERCHCHRFDDTRKNMAKKHRWQSYLYVKAYHELRGQFEHKQRMEMQRAAKDLAPLDACYYSAEHRRWITVLEVTVYAAVEVKVKEYLNERKER